MRNFFFLTDTNKKDRVEWATKMGEWELAQWQKVLFSDEKKFNLTVRTDWHAIGMLLAKMSASSRNGGVKV